MNTSSRPRFTCRTVRWWSALTERQPSRHLAHCAECQHFFAACANLDTALRRDAARMPSTAPADLERGILAAVHAARASATETARARPTPRWPVFAAAFGAAAALAIMTLARYERSPSPEELAPAAVAAVLDSAATLSDRWWNSVVPTASTAIQDNGLQREMASVYADAQSALDFLALNFLPTTTAKANISPAERDRTTRTL